jgi:hypothetical protein
MREDVSPLYHSTWSLLVKTRTLSSKKSINPLFISLKGTRTMSNESGKPGDGPSMPKVPTVAEIQASLKSFIKTTVSTCNKGLYSLEQTSEQVSKPLVATMKSVQKEGEVVAHKAIKAYEIRHEYGPHIVAGSALFFGSIAGLRRGRLPAFLVGTSVGFAAYVAVYEVDLYKFPDIIFGKKKED